MSLSETIYFNDVALTSMIPDAHVIDIIVGSIESAHSSIARVVTPGSIFASRRDGVRTISIAVELPFNKEECLVNHSLLRAWAESDQPKLLQLPNRTNGYIKCMLIEMSELSVSKWYEPVKLDFIAYDPYFYGVTRTAGEGESFTVAGDASVPFTIKAQLAAAAESPSWKIDNKYDIALDGTVGVGTLVIDTENGLITLGNLSVNSMIALNSRFVRLAPGVHSIVSQTDSTIAWKDGWR